MTLIESLPPRPLSDHEVTSLAEADATQTCTPLAGLRTEDDTIPPSDMVVGLRLTIDDTSAHLLVYDAGDDAWTTATPDGDTPFAALSTAAASDHALDWLAKHYEYDSLALL